MMAVVGCTSHNSLQIDVRLFMSVESVFWMIFQVDEVFTFIVGITDSPNIIDICPNCLHT